MSHMAPIETTGSPWRTSSGAASSPVMDRYIAHISPNGHAPAPHRSPPTERRLLHFGEEATAGGLFHRPISTRGVSRDTLFGDGSDGRTPDTTTEADDLVDYRNTPQTSHHNMLASALGLPSGKRVLCYSPASPPASSKMPKLDMSIFSDVPRLHGNKPRLEGTKKDDSVRTIVPSKVLDAEGLRNDFYTNLVSWSPSSARVAVGLGVRAYIWSKANGASPVVLPDCDMITCVSFSHHDLLAIGSKTGRVTLCVAATKKAEWSVTVHQDIGISCISWFKDSKIFIVGDESGFLTFFQVKLSKSGLSVTETLRMKCHEQHICGMAIRDDEKQMAVGGNDNCCTIWNIANQKSPKLMFFLPHLSAVKAIAYCPWSQALIATGGGTKDRMIKFWHANSGTLLSSFNTGGQITSLLWSKSKKEIMATFGFSEDNNLLCIYSYPSMKPLVRVPGATGTRVLGMTPSPTASSICIAVNDQSVRFYNLWKNAAKINAGTQGRGLYGSDIIALTEGEGDEHGIIR